MTPPRDATSRHTLATASALMIALVAGLAFALLPAGFLLGTAPVWTAPAGDAAQHAIGGWYFLADAWRLPLLLVPSLGVPGGTNIALTDSIPLAALLAKLARPLLGTSQVYLAAWLLLCFLLQGPAAAIALYACGVRRIVHLVLGGLLLTASPILLARIGHAALCGQFLVLLAIALHVRLLRVAGPAGLLLFLPLLAAAALTHAYLFAMVAALFAASLLEALWSERMATGAALAVVALTAAPLAALLWLCGYFGVGPIPIKPYGEWAFDLAAPFLPSYSLIFGVPAMPAGLDFETLAWAGAGQVALLLVAAIAWRREFAGVLARHPATAMTCVGLLLFAASYAVHVGGHVVLGVAPERVRAAVLGGARAALTANLGVLDILRAIGLALLLGGLLAWALGRTIALRRWRVLRLLAVAGAVVLAIGIVAPRALLVGVSTFQASARLAWVPLMLLVLLAVVAICRRLPPGLATGVLAAALLLQVVDTVPLWRSLHAQAVSPGRTTALPLADAMAAADDVRLVPSYLCAHAEPSEGRAELIARIMDAQVLAARAHRPIDSVRSSRMTAADLPALQAHCAAVRREVIAQIDRPGRLTIFAGAVPGLPAGCRTVPGWTYCLAPSR